MTDEQRFDDESPQPFEGLEGEPANRREIKEAADVALSADYRPMVHHFDLKITPLWQNVQVDETKIDRRFFKYTKRRMVNGAGVNHYGGVPAIFDFAFWHGEYPSYEIGFGHHWVLRVAFRFAYKESIELRLEFLKQGTLSLMGWWPGA